MKNDSVELIGFQTLGYMKERISSLYESDFQTLHEVRLWTDSLE